MFPRALANKSAWCGICSQPYDEGDLITGVRWGSEPPAWANCHLACCEQSVTDHGLRRDVSNLNLPLLEVKLVTLPKPQRGRKYLIMFGGHEVYATGQLERATGVDEFLREHSGQGLFDHE